MTPGELLAAYDREVRASFPDRVRPGWIASQDGPLTRCLTSRGGFAMSVTGLMELNEHELDGLIDRTVAFYAGHGRRFEWKTFDHDRPWLADALRARGLVPDEHEAVVIGRAETLAGEPVLPGGLVLRQVRDRVDLERVAALQTEVWKEDWSWLTGDLVDRVSDPSGAITVYVVEDGPCVVSAAWLVPITGTRFAGLWGGSTLEAYRGRGIYRALVSRRAQDAVDRGFTMLQIDASDDSRPILERLGLHVAGGTTPFIWTPSS